MPPPTLQAPRPSAVPLRVHLPVTSRPHHWFDLPGSNPGPVLLPPPPCPMLASLNPIDSSLEMFPEPLLSQCCCHSCWPRTWSLRLLSGVQGKMELSFHHPQHWCPVSGASPTSLSFPARVSSHCIRVTFISWHSGPFS